VDDQSSSRTVAVAAWAARRAALRETLCERFSRIDGRSVSVTAAWGPRRHAAARPRRPVPEPSSRIRRLGTSGSMVVEEVVAVVVVVVVAGGEADGRCSRSSGNFRASTMLAPHVLRPRLSSVRAGSRSVTTRDSVTAKPRVKVGRAVVPESEARW